MSLIGFRKERPSDLQVSEPPKKKQKISQTSKKQNTTVTSVTLPREKLLVFSRPQLDEFVANVTKGRTLTKEEKKEVSRQRKLIKNRNSAAASRQRKKQHQDSLESKHLELLNQQNSLKERISSLETSNSEMKQQVGYLHTLIQANPFTSAIWNRTRSLQKEYDLASLSMKITAKYLLLFLFCIYFLCIFAYSSSIPIPKALDNHGFSYINDISFEKDNYLMSRYSKEDSKELSSSMSPYIPSLSSPRSILEKEFQKEKEKEKEPLLETPEFKMDESLYNFDYGISDALLCDDGDSNSYSKSKEDNESELCDTIDPNLRFLEEETCEDNDIISEFLKEENAIPFPADNTLTFEQYLNIFLASPSINTLNQSQTICKHKY